MKHGIQHFQIRKLDQDGKQLDSFHVHAMTKREALTAYAERNGYPDFHFPALEPAPQNSRFWYTRDQDGAWLSILHY